MKAATSYQRTLAALGFGVLAAGEFWRHLLGWWGWGVLAVAVVVACVIELVRARVDVRRMPLWLFAFLLLSGLSIIWSVSPGSTALAVVGTLATTATAAMLAFCLNWAELLATLSTALRWILAASLLFELFVAVVLRDRLLPLWMDYSDLDRIPSTFYWSRGLLLEGGRIQGIVGNANTLSVLALIALVVFVCRLLARQGSAAWAWFWIAVAVANFALARSATVIVAAVVTAYVAALIVVTRRAVGRMRWIVGGGGALLAALLAIAAVWARGPLLSLLGRSADLTNRVDIWQQVGQLVTERPAAGWGWGFWAPWSWPVPELGELNDIGLLSAHNAWLDVLLQLGVIGLVVFALFVLGALVRSWSMAIEARSARFNPQAAPWPLNVAPMLLITVLLVQSIVESGVLWEFGFALLVIIAVKTGWRDPERAEAVSA